MEIRARQVPLLVILGILIFPARLRSEQVFGFSSRDGRGGNWDFEEWRWVPIPPDEGKALGKLVRQGIDINMDYRGPAYRRWTGHGTAGHMVEGAEAFRGKSVLVNNSAGKGYVEIGYHSSFNRILKPGATYSYEVALRGNGEFVFRASVEGLEPMTGNTKWLGFPDLIKVKLTDRWEVYKGTIRLPDYNDPNYRPRDLVSCAIMVPPGTVVYFDEMKITPQEE